MTDLSVASLPDKRLVAVSFSRAAASYDSVAELQRDVGHELMNRLPVGLNPQRWLDVGCGTGYFSRVLGQHFPHSEGLALDIAQGMLAYARPLGGPSTSSRVMPSACRCKTTVATWCFPAWRCNGARTLTQCSARHSGCSNRAVYWLSPVCAWAR